MSPLPRPDLPPGPPRDLVDALHDLHHRAGWPSLRTLARSCAVSHTTISKTFSSSTLPTWGVLELLVEAMDGDVTTFHDLWLAASSPTGSAPTPQIAGRRAELVAVRRHLETGTGLLLVTGEAGIGKTKLVATAANQLADDVRVLSGDCLPLSTDVPFLPFADLLHAAYAHPAPEWWKRALASAPAYVSTALGSLLPELGTAPVEAVADDASRYRLHTAVSAAIKALSDDHPAAVLIEDAHWADPATLDLLTHLVAGHTGCPVLCTWRLDDRATPDRTVEWFERVRRLPHVTELELRPLSEDETADQLRLLGHDLTGDLAERVHRRTQGLPLFTEQLSASLDDDTALPRLLADLLDRRFVGISQRAWAVTRVLGVADRPLSVDQLAAASGMVGRELTEELRDLRDRRLVSGTSDGAAQLQHPLLAEATRRRLVVGEDLEVHAALARVLGTSPGASAAEVARHWQGADDRRRELEWRIRAARAASAQFAVHETARQWARVVDLWPEDKCSAGDPPVTRGHAMAHALEALGRVDITAAVHLHEAAMGLVDDADPLDAAKIMVTVADHGASVSGITQERLEMAARAVAIFEQHAPSAAHVEALLRQESLISGSGDFGGAARVSARAVEVSRTLDEPRLLQGTLSRHAWNAMALGSAQDALALFDEARAITTSDGDPHELVERATNHTDVLLRICAGADRIVGAAADALAEAARFDLSPSAVGMLKANVGQGLREAGRLAEAREVVGAGSIDQPDRDSWAINVERFNVEVALGFAPTALERADAVSHMPLSSAWLRAYIAHCVGVAKLWAGQPQATLNGLFVALEEAVATDEAMLLGEPLTTAVRAAADDAEQRRLPRGGVERTELARQLAHLRKACASDPFAPHPMLGAAAAQQATWAAELARLTDTAAVEHWLRAATEWDKLTRPHDAGYCRWQAAQLAQATGRAGSAKRLLISAARDAREHVPLSQAIANTAGGRTSAQFHGAVHHREPTETST